MSLHSFNIHAGSVPSLEENEVRTMVDPNSKNDRKLQELMKVSSSSEFDSAAKLYK